MFFRYISTGRSGVKTTFGRATKHCPPGLAFFVPFVQKIHVVSNMVSQDVFELQVKTKDNANVNVKVAALHKIEPENSIIALFSLSDPVKQIESYVENVVRSKAQKMTIDELYDSTDEICNEVMSKLSDIMKMYGYTIVNTLVVNINPSNIVKDAMDSIVATERMKIAAVNEAEAEYIKKVRNAEGDKERKRLQGEGISEQRQAILKGYQTGIKELSNDLGIDKSEILNFVKLTQHLDTLETIGKSPNTKTIFVNHNPEDITNHNFRKMMMEAKE